MSANLRPALATDLVLVANSVRSIFNIGSLMRLGDALGACLVTTGFAPHPPHDQLGLSQILPDRRPEWEQQAIALKLQKTALSGYQSLLSPDRQSYFSELAEAINWLRAAGYAIVGVELMPQSIDYRQFEWPKRVALILGHEIAGLESVETGLIEQFVALPMAGAGSSLNVAQAAAAIGYAYLGKHG